MTIIPTEPQISAGCKKAREQLAAISGMFINYNNQITDAQLRLFIVNVLTASLNVPQPKEGHHP